jgi:hypothetical protein
MAKPKHIPISDVSALISKHGLQQAVLVAWDGHHTYVVTDGVDEYAADQAADGGNLVKRALGWPENLCHSVSTRVQGLHKRIKELEKQLKEKHG